MSHNRRDAKRGWFISELKFMYTNSGLAYVSVHALPRPQARRGLLYVKGDLLLHLLPILVHFKLARKF